MHGKKARFVSLIVLILAVVFGLVIVATQPAQAQTFSVLYNFTGGSDGGFPSAGPIQDSVGTLYGTTYGGGNGDGVVYEVSTAGTETVLYTFCSQTNCADGRDPETPLARDRAGNIYGTTGFGGASYGCCGVVFKLDTAGNETVLYSFTGSDGCIPWQGLVADYTENLYGTAAYCGSRTSNYGTTFKVDASGSLTILHAFAGPPSDGAYPWYGHLTMDEFGNLYGVTQSGGSNNYGVLYKLGQNGTLTLLHNFTGGTKDGCYPYGSVVQDGAGNLYGVTEYCGSHFSGTIWKVSKKGKETILHNFARGTSDGCNPYSGMARDSKGNLYGVTEKCGANNAGALYKLNASGGLTLLHSFDYADGAYPIGEVLRTTNGMLFGTTYQGGASNAGTVWSYVP